MHLSENDAVLISVCEQLNYIHQDTKSPRLIALCRRSITLNKFTNGQGVVAYTYFWLMCRVRTHQLPHNGRRTKMARSQVEM